MYADRSATRSFNPGSLGVALGINAAVIGALFFAGPKVGIFEPPAPITLIDPYIPAPPPPPEPAPEPKETLRTEQPVPPPPERIETPEAIVPTTSDTIVAGDPAPYRPADIEGVPAGTGPVDPPKPPPPLTVQPQVDPRYAADLQPVYPAGERRAGREGRVVARVLVGTDGRVKAIERIAAASDAFWRATEERALSKWRFTPGTRDGVPVEAWRVMTLTFRMED
jgi:periplasmic protein TonB